MEYAQAEIMTPDRKRLVQSPIFWCVLLLLVMEIGAGLLNPYAHYPQASIVDRNPSDKRGWPEYIRKPDEPSYQKLVVIIGNSQAVGKEIADSGKIYPGLIRAAGPAERIPYRLENWSSGGLRTTDIELLTIQAIKRKASLVILVLGFRNLDYPHQLNLDYPSTDINLLAGDPFFWSYLQDTTFISHVTLHDVLKRYFMMHSDLLRAKIAVYDALGGFIPQEMHRYIFGHTIVPIRSLDRMDDQGGSKSVRQLPHLVDKKDTELLEIAEEDIKVRLNTLNSFAGNLQKRMSRSGVKFILIWMPMSRRVLNDESYANLQDFIDRASVRLESSGIDTYNLLDAVPDTYYYTMSHYDERGHALIGDAVVDIIADELQ